MLLSTLANSIAAEHVGDDVAFTNVSTDTRSIQPGDLFVALKGERFDAHEFLDQAVAAGASALMVSSPVNQSVPQIVVADTRQGLGQLSQAWLAQFNPKKVAITGSCGKTSVKEMTAAILKEEGEVLATQGNFNNDIGVPLTLCRVREEHRFAVIEMGANHVGEIDYVSNLVRPDVALVNNVGPAHLEGFGSIENVARAKGEIYKNLAQAGVAVVNLDDAYAEYFLKQLEGKACLGFSMCSTNSDADIVLVHCDIENDGSCSFSVSVCGEQLTVKLGLLGKHNVSNALAAMALSKAVGASTQSMVKGLSALTPVKGRLCAVKDIRSFHVIDDSYNANPASMRSAIDLLASLENKTV
ncbi:MAG: UDP-N-acetylmuramoyl-tripeptide--D-alanyl-D-alanine ligase, partial [Pseudomonadales bacterium]|nr:UDP-N-acetylmuramoyl-tripeptide--D-alanyl-D-alanine ligase [Pseudomonadales bacterium]